MMGRSPRCYIPSFLEIGPLDPWGRFLKGFLPYMCGIRVNGGNACGDTPYRETNVDTSYMRIPNETSVC